MQTSVCYDADSCPLGGERDITAIDLPGFPCRGPGSPSCTQNYKFKDAPATTEQKAAGFSKSEALR
jgi:hypothetical protein